MQVDPRDFDLHINFPGGTPIDGPSAGITIATAIYSAITGKPISNIIAMTGEISIRGAVLPVGGVPAKIEAAERAGAKCVIIPKENWQEIFEVKHAVKIIPVQQLEEVIELALEKDSELTTPNPDQNFQVSA